ncbi:MAG TPA: hypothetical protein VLI54_03555 [Bacillota bacterium]|nr:hypothetical protein [Bacillota bacterium]
MARRIEGGPAAGLEPGGDLDMANEVLARNYGGSRYDTLQDAFGARDDGTSPLLGWDGANAEELLRGALGPAEAFAVEYDEMSDEEKAKHFPDPDVADIVRLWADLGRPTA